MRKILIVFILLAAYLVCFFLNAHAEPKGDFFIGSSAFMIATSTETDENPEFYQLNLGVRFSKEDTVSLEAIRWRYYGPLGSDEQEKYPGSVRSEGYALAYQYFFSGNLYTAIHILSLQQTFLDEDEKKIGEGRQIFCTFRLGYHIGLGDTFFLEPSLAMTYWPVNEGLPDSFQEKEDKWRNYTFEPGLHIGMNF